MFMYIQGTSPLGLKSGWDGFQSMELILQEFCKADKMTYEGFLEMSLLSQHTLLLIQSKM